MKIKKRWIYIVFILVFLPTPADSQFVSLSKLESGKYNFRLGYVRLEYVRSVGGTLSDEKQHHDRHGMWLGGDRGFGDRTKVSTSASIFFDSTDKTIDDIYQSSQIVHIIPLGSTGLDCFFFGDFGVFIDRDILLRQNDPFDIRRGRNVEREGKRRFISIWLGGGLGLSKTLGRFTPFVGLFYQEHVYTKKYELPSGVDNRGHLLWYTFRNESELLRSVALSMGAEIEITQHIDLTGRVELGYQGRKDYLYSADHPFSAFYIGLSLH